MTEARLEASLTGWHPQPPVAAARCRVLWTGNGAGSKAPVTGMSSLRGLCAWPSAGLRLVLWSRGRCVCAVCTCAVVCTSTWAAGAKYLRVPSWGTGQPQLAGWGPQGPACLWGAWRRGRGPSPATGWEGLKQVGAATTRKAREPQGGPSQVLGWGAQGWESGEEGPPWRNVSVSRAPWR